MNFTIVTANFYFNDQTRSVKDCLHNMKTLLHIPCNLVIYCNTPLYQGIKEIRDQVQLIEKTVYVVIPFESIWSFQFYNQVQKNREIFWPTADPRAGVESHLITNNKFDFVLTTIKANPFSTTKFAWLDSNIGTKGSKIARDFTNEKFINLLNQTGNKFHIQILNVVDKKYLNNDLIKEYYSKYQWVVCGCLWTLENNLKNIIILNRLKDIFIETLNLGCGHGEELNFLKILEEFYDDIDRSYGDYQDIVENFITPTTNLHYIFFTIITKYYNFGYFKECYHACKALSNASNDHPFEFYFYYYESALKTKTKNEAKNILFHLISKINSNTFFETKYNEQQEKYDSLFKLAF